MVSHLQSIYHLAPNNSLFRLPGNLTRGQVFPCAKKDGISRDCTFKPRNSAKDSETYSGVPRFCYSISLQCLATFRLLDYVSSIESKVFEHIFFCPL